MNQDGPSLIIEAPPPNMTPKKLKFILFFSYFLF